jgi:hypothetical protein
MHGALLYGPQEGSECGQGRRVCTCERGKQSWARWTGFFFDVALRLCKLEKNKEKSVSSETASRMNDMSEELLSPRSELLDSLIGSRGPDDTLHSMLAAEVRRWSY